MPSQYETHTNTCMLQSYYDIRDHSLFIPGDGLARMRGGPSQMQDSQRGVINKSAHKEAGLPEFLFLCYFQTNTFSAFGTNGTWFASLLKANSS